MKPYQERTADEQYKNLLREILAKGLRTPSRQGTDALTLMGATPMHFKLENGFPMITERSVKGFWLAGYQGNLRVYEWCAHTYIT